MTMQEQQAICETCVHRHQNPDGGWCYMMESPLVGCLQLEPFKRETPVATWHISLDVECPKCGEDVDLTDYDDFWVDSSIEPAETVQGYDVICPECRHEFEVDTQY